MKLAPITAVIALAATSATPLAVSASEDQKPLQSEINGRTMTEIESVRYDRSERSNPNWDRVERQ